MPSPSPSAPRSKQSIRAICFDAYGTLFDVHSVGTLAEQLFPGKGQAISNLWREKQIEYTRLRTLSGQHRDFWSITQDALVYCAERLQLDLHEEAKRRLMAQYACLSAFPENLGTLKTLKGRGLSLAILSNGTPEMLDIAVKSAGMGGLFEHLISIEQVKKFKTAPEAYQLGPSSLGLPAREILFVSSNCWDACCATWFGYTTFWVNRLGHPLEQLGVTPHGQGHRLSDLNDFIDRWNDRSGGKGQ